MKVKLLILSLLFTIPLSAQDFWWWWDSDEDVPPPYEMEAERYFASLETPLSDSAKTKINNFVAMLKDSLEIDSLAEKFDVMYLLANETPEAGLHNLVKRMHDATAVNSPTFTQWEGFAGNGTTSYINPNYNSSTDAVMLTQNSLSMGAYSRTDRVSSTSIFGNYNTTGTTGGIFLAPRTLIFQSFWRANYTPSQSVAQDNTLGLFIITRTASNQANLYQNGVSEHQVTNASVASLDRAVYLLCVNANGSPAEFTAGQVSFFFVGGGLTAIEVRQVTNCIEVYLDNLGKGVIP